jgi:hypothetical protein
VSSGAEKVQNEVNKRTGKNWVNGDTKQAWRISD